ncbi:uncharacterized protein KY384_001164 [Bacidia gigantensis]|uniref:uncharacterized protein n=1 Tax=Bacidia gigantensis TaxID=2732470 RepID=UPI001D05081A|nr:uncharacterized protein KY384_001164 [Bacidia gigantensis]KAG8534320.1 hypothetical protein KY384_001164 [Bacidia gigantensis]
MIRSKAAGRLCASCSNQLLHLYTYGLTAPPVIARHGPRRWAKQALPQLPYQGSRRFTQRTQIRDAADVANSSVQQNAVKEAKTPEEIEAIARQARQMFGETLPKNFLSTQEYNLYERLYGPPVAATSYAELKALSPDMDEDAETLDESVQSVSQIQLADGNWEDIVSSEESRLREEEEEEEEDLEEDDLKIETEDATEVVEENHDEIDGTHPEEEQKSSIVQAQEEFNARVETARANAAIEFEEQEAQVVAEEQEAESEEEVLDHEAPLEDSADEPLRLVKQKSFEEEQYDEVEAAGRSGTSPSTIQLPVDTLVNPTSDILASASNKHLSEVAHKVFGGAGFPNSTVTMKRPNLKQEPIGLEANQHFMSEMEGNAFLTAIMPGAYASILSILVEVRKRLGSEWLQNLMRRPEGPRVLDAGAGGAGVLAWREVLRAEWESGYPEGTSKEEHPPHGKSTVVTGSDVLRHKASRLLDNTTFIPRLPDYDPSQHHPSLESNNPQPRKQYDVIIAPYTLWTLREDYMRKYQIQNFWSLLDPKGGVLILLEKGVARGFELIAGARENLLRYHISSPESAEIDDSVQATSENQFGPRDKGMIIAPCTNHVKCPMFITAGRRGRKDFCHFSQRFIRPPYLQTLFGGGSANHEDVNFSYIALQRGVDQRQDLEFEQGGKAAEAAFKGYGFEDDEQEDVDESSDKAIEPLTFPRSIRPPLKRHGHVIIDVCTPAGKIERWTVPRSFSKQAYRDARKSKWGDLWGLGAKSRVLANIRVGRDETRTPDEMFPESGDRKGEKSRKPSADSPPKARSRPNIRTKKPSKMKHKKLVVEE